MAESESKYPAEASAKRFVANLANHYQDTDLGSFVQHNRDDSSSDLEKTYIKLRLVGNALRHAFETSDEYERDWFLFWARVENAKAQLLPWSRMPGVIPMAEDSEIEQYVSFVQRRRAKRMAVCAREACKACFFKIRNRDKYCKRRCAKAVVNEGNLRWWNQVGRVKRAEKKARPV